MNLPEPVWLQTFSFTLYTKEKTKGGILFSQETIRQSKNRYNLWLCFKNGRFAYKLTKINLVSLGVKKEIG